MARKNKNEEAVAPEAALEQVEGGGMGIDEGIVLATFFLLILSVVLVYLANQTYL